MNLPEILVTFLFGMCGITITSSQSSGDSTKLRCYACISEEPCSSDDVGIQQCDPLAGLPCVSSNLTYTFQLDSGEKKITSISTGCLRSEVDFTPPTRNGCIDGSTYLDLVLIQPPPGIKINLPTADGKVCFCETDLCNTQTILPASLRNCPDGFPPVSCDVNPCEKAECPLNPHAVCIVNYCNRQHHCLAEWFHGERNRVDCGETYIELVHHQYIWLTSKLCCTNFHH
ncbi:hypothetical protein HOLleu_30611 [Holothuria leucospilota]|uniref:Uncharacterized protein n=1 Tax=Holothuria leucospilota TaxID=206669 RepID=A0A9Q1GX32_HOLLE|nr:hypothetical protein HOLleu_30611 [Holothuria leucospilota]